MLYEVITDAPEILDGGVPDALRVAAARGFLDPADAEGLLAARRLWNALLILLRLTAPEGVSEDDLPRGLRARLAQATGAVDFDALKQQMETTAARTVDAFTRTIDAPAAAVSRDPKESP